MATATARMLRAKKRVRVLKTRSPMPRIDLPVVLARWGGGGLCLSTVPATLMGGRRPRSLLPPMHLRPSVGGGGTLYLDLIESSQFHVDDGLRQGRVA